MQFVFLIVGVAIGYFAHRMIHDRTKQFGRWLREQRAKQQLRITGHLTLL